MAVQSIKRFLHNIDAGRVLERQELYARYVYGIINRLQSGWSSVDKVETNIEKERKDTFPSPVKLKVGKKLDYDSEIFKSSSDDDETSESKWRLELDWLPKAIEPALQLCRQALPTGNGFGNRSPHSTRSVSEIIAAIQRSKLGVQDWTFSDLTIGLYLIYLRQASSAQIEDVKGIQISSEPIIHDLIYHIELAKGSYKNSAAGLARNSMLREDNILKFVRNSSVMRPGYFIGIDTRKRLIILGIRGTHTVYDLVTDIVSSSHEEVTFEGYSTHFGTAEAARWFLSHEIGHIRKCLEKHKGFKLRLVGHSLGGAIASLLAIMLRKKSSKELGFSPDIVSAVGIATPPCVSKELAESCSEFVFTIVMQDDIIPRLSLASLERLRSEIAQTDWMSIIEKEDWKSFRDLVTNAKQVVSSVQDVARRLADYANFGSKEVSDGVAVENAPAVVSRIPSTYKPASETEGKRGVRSMPEELFVPGTLYYLKREVDSENSRVSSRNTSKPREFYTLWQRQPGEHFQKIMLSSNLISDHKCDSHYQALRDVLKGLPCASDEAIFR
ncbi:Fungal lipase-like domain [Dillenia turbinata]|uniref:Fungal lipase-like domain n=1 Tax=Dillenia turbinata TaxID=194707 RepID=A0AAN8W0R7_9MAGN